MSRDKLSADSLSEATRSRAKFSGHGQAKGAAGYVSDTDDTGCRILGATGQNHIIDTVETGFEYLRIGGAWQPLQKAQSQNFLDRLLKRTRVRHHGVDLDIGCLYELQNGERGAVQAFGELFGAYDSAPFIALSGDDRTGDDDDDDDGEDEILMVNGAHWGDIRRMLIYFYIYDGVNNWAEIKPQVQIRVPGHPPLVINPHTYKSELAVCAVAGIENVRGGIKLTNFTEYYPGHAEMDRAHGYGLQWEDGQKS